jgi:serine/threonine-protein kinase RsbW
MSSVPTLWKRLASEIESRLEAVPLLGQVACLLCTAAGLTPVEGREVEVCVVEAVNNSIQHAYQGDPDRRVELEITLLPGQLVFHVWDSGTPADAARMNADHRGALEVQLGCVKDISESGRGLAIIQEVMDSFEYTPGTERNRFRMTKRHALRQLPAQELNHQTGIAL